MSVCKEKDAQGGKWIEEHPSNCGSRKEDRMLSYLSFVLNLVLFVLTKCVVGRADVDKSMLVVSF